MEKNENRQLKDMLEERESRIAELEMEISLLNKVWMDDREGVNG